jgi:hypothetical protein
MHSRADALRLAAEIARRFEEPVPHLALPRIFEFIVFGSTSKEENVTVGDLDIALLVSHTDDHDCKFVYLPRRLDEIMRELRKTDAPRIMVDFEPLWVKVLWDKSVQQFYWEDSKDPNLVENILGSFLRWDSLAGDFKKADRAYLDKYVPQSSV